MSLCGLFLEVNPTKLNMLSLCLIDQGLRHRFVLLNNRVNKSGRYVNEMWSTREVGECARNGKVGKEDTGGIL